jgi:hypothetical protein
MVNNWNEISERGSFRFRGIATDINRYRVPSNAVNFELVSSFQHWPFFQPRESKPRAINYLIGRYRFD